MWRQVREELVEGGLRHLGTHRDVTGMVSLLLGMLQSTSPKSLSHAVAWRLCVPLHFPLRFSSWAVSPQIQLLVLPRKGLDSAGCLGRGGERHGGLIDAPAAAAARWQRPGVPPGGLRRISHRLCRRPPASLHRSGDGATLESQLAVIPCHTRSLKYHSSSTRMHWITFRFTGDCMLYIICISYTICIYNMYISYIQIYIETERVNNHAAVSRGCFRPATGG